MAEPKVMKAPNEAIDFDDPRIKFPLLGSGKLDGMRIKVMPGGVFSLNHKQQNAALHTYLAPVCRLATEQQIILDCELWSPRLAFNEIMSAVANPNPRDDLSLQVFDMMTIEEWYNGGELPFMNRVEEYKAWCKRNVGKTGGLVEPVDQTLIKDPAQLEELFDICLKANLEGCMVRPPLSRYKHGRSTLNEGLMLKFKRWTTVDARIVGFNQGTEMKKEVQAGPRDRNAMGEMEQSSKKDTRVSVDRIGSVIVELRDGTRFSAVDGKKECIPALGRDLTPLEFQRCDWHTRNNFLDRWVEIRYQETGCKDKPRFPSIKRFRPDLDKQYIKESLAALFIPPSKSGESKFFR